MTGLYYIAMVAPTVAILLSAAFFVLWRQQRALRYLLAISVSFAACGAAFILHDFIDEYRFGIPKLLGNLLFFVTMTLLSVAILLRCGLRVPRRALAAIVCAGTLALIWTGYVQPRLDNRIFAVNLAYAAIFAVTLIQLRQVRTRSLIERLLFCLTALLVVGFGSRPLWVIFDTYDYSSYLGFNQSVYWSTVQFASVVLCLAFALVFLLAVATDLMAALKHEAEHDKLSGVLNRRGFEDRATAALANPLNNTTPITLVLADLDHFKQVNDTFGHAAGDLVIARFGQALTRAGADHAIIGRIGGEEFAILLLDVTAVAARNYADRVRLQFAGQDHPTHADRGGITASFGVYARRPGENLADLYRGADRALYHAKHTGRDRISTADPTPFPASA